MEKGRKERVDSGKKGSESVYERKGSRNSSTIEPPRAILWGFLLMVGLSIPSCHHNGTERKSEAQVVESKSGLDIRREILSRTYKVYCAGATGSGSLIYENLFITANHVIEDNLIYGREIGLKFEDDYIHWGWEVRYQDWDNDIAILGRPGTEKNGERLWKGRSRDYLPGDRVYCSGYPWGIGPVFTDGYISKVEERSIIVSVNALPGSSGSGIYRENGEFIGLLVRGHVSMGVWSQFIFQVIPLSMVKDGLKELGID